MALKDISITSNGNLRSGNIGQVLIDPVSQSATVIVTEPTETLMGTISHQHNLSLVVDDLTTPQKTAIAAAVNAIKDALAVKYGN